MAPETEVLGGKDEDMYDMRDSAFSADRTVFTMSGFEVDMCKKDVVVGCVDSSRIGAELNNLESLVKVPPSPTALNLNWSLSDAEMDAAEV